MSKKTSSHSFLLFMQNEVARQRKLGRERTAETYAAALSSLSRFCRGTDLTLVSMQPQLIMEYEAWLKGNGLSMNTVSFYMRILRAAYNRAAERGLCRQCHPFKKVYTGIAKTQKRALTLQQIKALQHLDLSARPLLAFARDLFLLSFYTRGMSFIDMAYLRRTDLSNGVLTYRRHKTGRMLNIRWEPCMQLVANRHAVPGSLYLLPIITEVENERKQYRNALRLVNLRLKEVARLAGIAQNLSMYCARHSWASIAHSLHVPLPVISQGMGHQSEAVTQIYLASLEHSVIDHANTQVLNSVLDE